MSARVTARLAARVVPATVVVGGDAIAEDGSGLPELGRPLRVTTPMGKTGRKVHRMDHRSLNEVRGSHPVAVAFNTNGGNSVEPPRSLPLV